MASIRSKILSILIALLLFPLATLQAMESIESFKSRITLHPNGRMTVVETITVRAEGVKVKSGIYRDYPKSYKTVDGQNKRIGFKLLSVLRDGNTIPYSVKNIPKHYRIIMGTNWLKLPPGKYTYTLKYETRNNIRPGATQDMLFYDITGHDWTLPILETSFEIHVPDHTDITKVQGEVLIGRHGMGHVVNLPIQDDLSMRKTIDQMLKNGEGVTVRITFPASTFLTGFMDYPYEFLGTKLTAYALSIFGFVIIIMFLNAVIIYQVFTVRIIDIRNTINDSPPKNCSPGLARFVLSRKFDKKVLSSALVSMATKGFLSFEKVKEGYSIHKLKTADKKLLSFDEKIVAKFLVTNKKITLSPINYTKIKNTLSELRAGIKNNPFGIKYSAWSLTDIIALTMVVVYSILCVFLSYSSFSSWPILGIFVSAILYFTYRKHLKGSLREGLQMRQKLFQFKRYMISLSKEEHSEHRNIDQKTYENLIPYAIAFGIEKKWDQVLSNHTRQSNKLSLLDLNANIPIWYAGGFNSSASGFRIVAPLSNNLGNSLTVSSSSSLGGGGSGGSSGSAGGGGYGEASGGGGGGGF